MPSPSTTFSAASALRCTVCAHTQPLHLSFFGCPACGASEVVDYDVARLSPDGWLDPAARGIWRYHRLLPLPDPSHAVSLGEGQTPLLPLTHASGASAAVHLKVEAANPTGSHKDRFNAVVTSLARHFGAERLICSTTGNHGVSLAAYAARGGAHAAVLCDHRVPPIALAELRAFGAAPYVLDPAVPAIQLIAQLCEGGDWVPSVRSFRRPPHRPVASPFGVEGYKTIAYELVEQLGGRPPDAVFSPVGGGDGLTGLWRGFNDLRALGVIDSLPRLFACQPEASPSLVRAFECGAAHVAPVTPQPSVALSIVDAQSGDHALAALTESRGGAVAVSETELRDAHALGARNAVLMDPASAASLAGYLKLARGGTLTGVDVAVCVITGGGGRWMPPADPDAGATAPPLWSDVGALLAALVTGSGH